MAKKQPNLAEYLKRILAESRESFRIVSDRAQKRGFNLSESYLAGLLVGRVEPDRVTVHTLKAVAAGMNRPLSEILIASGLIKPSDLIPSRRPKPKASKTPKTVFVVLKDPPRKEIGFMPQKKREPKTTR